MNDTTEFSNSASRDGHNDSTPMDSLSFDYEPRPSQSPREVSRRQRKLGRRARGFTFVGDTGAGSYHYDLRTRHPVAALIKRVLDVLMAVGVITLLSPVFLIIIALVKCTSPGPVTFHQRRIGFRGLYFEMYKFRTMYDGSHLKEKELAAETGTSFLKIKDDPRITPLGRFLRRYSLDELPQLFNVLEGTMSMVGPRPLLVSDLDKLTRRSFLRRFSVPPGITGLWQVAGRSDCSEIERLTFDREYSDQWSLALDFKILLRTFKVVVTGRGAV